MLFRLFAYALLYLTAATAAAGTLSAARVWPSPDYTRIALESAEPLSYKYFSLTSPHRLVVDIENLEPSAALAGLPALVNPTDPYLANVRAGVNRLGVMRLVFELKMPVKPSVFALKPLGNYGQRLVIDLYAANTSELSPTTASGVSISPPETRNAEPKAVEKRLDEPKATEPKSAELKTTEVKPAEAKATSAATKPPVKFARQMVVAIDPGHGGEDPGAVGASGSHEKNITLTIARKLKQKIDDTPNMRAHLTRDGDYFIALHERVNKARAVKADLFLSIHADAFIKPEARGSSVFALSENGATSAAARWLAKKENDADLIGGINIDVKDKFLKRTLIDLSQTATITDSLRLGRHVLKEIGEVNDLHKDRVEQAGFAVLKAPDIPSILVETAFISNPAEEKRLNDEAYQDKLVDAIFSGIKSYFDKHPQKFGTKVAKEM